MAPILTPSPIPRPPYHTTPGGTRRFLSTAPAPAITAEALNQIPAEGTMMQSPMFKFLDFLFEIPLIHDIMFGVYRKQIVQKSEKMGLPWTAFMDEQWEMLPQLRNKADEILDPTLTIPGMHI
jgi:hypothetical protein